MLAGLPSKAGWRSGLFGKDQFAVAGLAEAIHLAEMNDVHVSVGTKEIGTVDALFTGAVARAARLEPGEFGYWCRSSWQGRSPR